MVYIYILESLQNDKNKRIKMLIKLLLIKKVGFQMLKLLLLNTKYIVHNVNSILKFLNNLINLLGVSNNKILLIKKLHQNLGSQRILLVFMLKNIQKKVLKKYNSQAINVLIVILVLTYGCVLIVVAQAVVENSMMVVVVIIMV